MAKIFEELRKEYEYIIVDCPPILAVSDAAIVSKLCDGCLFVVSQSKTEKNAARESVKILRDNNVNILGCIFCGITSKGGNYYNSKYKYTTLFCKYRHINGIQFQIFYISYTFLKYNRPVKNIPFKFIQLNDSILANFKYSLFCINKGAGNYSYYKYYNSKILLEYLFPIPSPYEIIDYSLLNIAFNTTYTLSTLLRLNEKQMIHLITKKECFYLIIKIILIFKL